MSLNTISQNDEDDLMESQEVRTLREQIDLQLEQENFSGSILVAKNGIPIYLGVKGFSDYDKGILNHLDTKYNLGSMNKMFTAIAIAQLAQEGKLDFADSITKHLTDYPNHEFEVTVHIPLLYF